MEGLIVPEVGTLAYNLLLSVHVLAIIAWMAGMLYLPRLYVYHAMAAPGGEAAKSFEVMEEKLLRIIMNGALLVVWITGLWLAFSGGWFSGQGWLHAKLVLVLAMSGLHGWFAALRKKFLKGRAPFGHRTLRLVNELPFILLIPIVLMVIVKPF